MAGADVPGLAAVIGFYGLLVSRFGVQGPIERAADIRCPLLGLFGGADQAIPVEQVEQFDGRLDEVGVEHEIHVYAGAPHSFFDRQQEKFADASEDASEDAWRRMLAFLDQHAAS
jgi:carboxymethylenebutenolidase